jgi:sugar phosphate isomerase/epimerase
MYNIIENNSNQLEAAVIITGISDEAGKDIKTQIKAHKDLGWDYLELRLVNGKNASGALSDAEFDETKREIETSGMKVAAFGSAIGNWSRHINDDFSTDLSDLKITAKRMKSLGAKYVRIMTWKGDGVELSHWRKEAIRRCKELSKIAEDEGIILAHENCTGWGGLSADNMIELKHEVGSKNFVLLFDTGNVTSYGMDVDKFFNGIRKHLSYIHIKDAKNAAVTKSNSSFTYPGEGDAKIPEILRTVLLEDKYDGFISIEPHVSAIVHAGAAGAAPDPEHLYKSYIKYGSMLKDIVAKIKK